MNTVPVQLAARFRRLGRRSAKDSTPSTIFMLPPEQREGIALGYASLGYVSLDAARAGLRALCNVVETRRLEMPAATWGTIKASAGTHPVRVR